MGAKPAFNSAGNVQPATTAGGGRLALTGPPKIDVKKLIKISKNLFFKKNAEAPAPGLLSPRGQGEQRKCCEDKHAEEGALVAPADGAALAGLRGGQPVGQGLLFRIFKKKF